MPKQNHYEVLGVDPKATQDQIKKAYRKKAAKAHPDKGGSHDEMTSISIAYTILSDPFRRENYDLNGADFSLNEEEQAIRNRLIHELNGALHQIVNDPYCKYPILTIVKNNLNVAIKDVTANLEKVESVLGKLNNQKNKVKLKKTKKSSPKEDYFSVILEAAIKDVTAQKQKLDTDRSLLKKVLLEVDNYEEDSVRESILQGYHPNQTFVRGF